MVEIFTFDLLLKTKRFSSVRKQQSKKTRGMTFTVAACFC